MLHQVNNPIIGHTYQFIYGGDGKRITEKTNSSDSKQYINDVSVDLERVLIAKDLTNSTDNYYLYGAGIVSEGGVSAANRNYYLEDGLGNIRDVTDNSGDSVATYTYDAYGNLQDGSSSDEFLFKGENLNPNTGLYYMRARYYNPTTGSFISRDPLSGDIMNPQAQHGYNYVNGNPINLSDPSGKIVYNTSDQVILVKAENEVNDEYHFLQPHQEYPGAQDGVIFQNGTIYKNNTGVNITVGNNVVSNATLRDTALDTIENLGKSALNLLGKSYAFSGSYRLGQGGPNTPGQLWTPNICW